MLALFIIDERLGAVRHIAHAFENGAMLPDEIIPLPEGMLEKIAARNFSAPFIVDPEEDEIFRHERGAFTGAVAESRGRYERADGGTIFLDEIGELPPTAGSFREDLWYRLSGFPLIVPPVRAASGGCSSSDAPFRDGEEQRARDVGTPSIAPGALLRLMEYAWPGNVRELENLVECELIRHRSGPLTFDAVLPREKREKVFPQHRQRPSIVSTQLGRGNGSSSERSTCIGQGEDSWTWWGGGTLGNEPKHLAVAPGQARHQLSLSGPGK